VKVCNNYTSRQGVNDPQCKTADISIIPVPQLTAPNFTTSIVYTATIYENPYDGGYGNECTDPSDFCTSGNVQLIDSQNCHEVTVTPNKLYAFDEDEGAKITYISDPDFPQFCVVSDYNVENRTAGVARIALRSGSRLDYEASAQKTFTLLIGAEDNTDVYVSTTFVITLLDSNDAPCAIRGETVGACPTLIYSINETYTNGYPLVQDSIAKQGYFATPVCDESGMNYVEATQQFETSTGASCSSSPYWQDQDDGDSMTLKMCPDNKDSSDCSQGHTIFRADFDTDMTVKIVLISPANIDFENRPEWNAEVIATDTASSPLTGVGTIKIKIIDINEPPTYSDPGEFSVKEIDVLTKLDTIASVNNKKVLCEELKRKHSGFFTWFDPTCELETTGEQVGSIVLRDVDANSRLTISIQKIVATKHNDVNVTTTESLLVLGTGCSNVVTDTTCTIDRTSVRNLYSWFDAELYKEMNVFFRLEEASDVCNSAQSQYIGTPCIRHTILFTVKMNIVDINDVVVHAVKYNKTLSMENDQHVLNTKGGEKIALHGFNFGSVDKSNDENVTVAYGTVVDQQSRTHTYAPTCIKPDGHDNNNEVLICDTTPGLGSHHTWSVKYGTHVSEPSLETTSYRAPLITGVTVSNSGGLDTSGAESNTITFTGKNLGSSNSSNEWSTPVSTAKMDYIGLGQLTRLSQNVYRVNQASTPKHKNNRCGLGMNLAAFAGPQLVNKVSVRLKCSGGQSEVENVPCTQIFTGTVDQVYGDLSNDNERSACQQETRWIHRGCYDTNGFSLDFQNNIHKSEPSQSFNSEPLKSDSSSAVDAIEKCAAQARLQGQSYFVVFKNGLCQFLPNDVESGFRSVPAHTNVPCNDDFNGETDQVDVFEILGLKGDSINAINEGSQIFYGETSYIKLTLDEDIGNVPLSQEFEIFMGVKSWLSSSNLYPGNQVSPLSNTRDKPGNYDIAGGQFINWRHTLCDNFNDRNCGCKYSESGGDDVITCTNAPAGVGARYLVTMNVGGQVSNAIDFEIIVHPF
jgi:hypothetical protein